MNKRRLFFLSCLLVSQLLSAREDTIFIKKNRIIPLLSGETALFAGSLIILDRLWYSDYPRSSFHSFNDNKEWLQMDKAGHLCTSYHIGKIGFELFRWTGIKEKRAVWYAGALGFFYLSAIEVMDAHSAQWGFSAGDLTANALGTFTFISQQLLWKEQRCFIKYSFLPSPFAQYRPELLGKNYLESSLKDYNGQTYWLCINPKMFAPSWKTFPAWLNIAIGYGADGMTGARENPLYISPEGKTKYFERERQFYLSLDLNLSALPFKSKAWKAFSSAIGIIKIPAPAIEFNRKGMKGNLIGF